MVWWYDCLTWKVGWWMWKPLWHFSSVCFQMFPQIACLNRDKVTLVTFVWLFSTVNFQMSPQITRLNRCKVTLVAFVWLFSTVCFQMFPQITCMRRWIVTLMAFVWFFCIISFFHLASNIGICYTGIITCNTFIHYNCEKGGLWCNTGKLRKIWLSCWHWSGRMKLEREIHDDDETDKIPTLHLEFYPLVFIPTTFIIRVGKLVS